MATEIPELTAHQMIEATRKIRKVRRAAVIAFAEALGFDASQVASISVVDGVIRVNTYVTDVSGAKIMVESDGDTLPARVEIGMYFYENDLDEQLERLQGFEGFLNGDDVMNAMRGTVRE